MKIAIFIEQRLKKGRALYFVQKPPSTTLFSVQVSTTYLIRQVQAASPFFLQHSDWSEKKKQAQQASSKRKLKPLLQIHNNNNNNIMPSRTITILSAALLLLPTVEVNGFLHIPTVNTPFVIARNHHNILLNCAKTDDEGVTTAEQQAERLLARAKSIREDLNAAVSSKSNNQSDEGNTSTRINSEFSLSSGSNNNNNSYRIYLDIGREPGTWMDPRWGASGKRIECTIDISFLSPQQGENMECSSEEIATALIKTVTTKTSKLSPVFKLQHAPFARLRSGFDKMKIEDGGYCIESGPKSSTLRFCLSVSGTGGSSSASYGDISIPEGKLYFALPYFGTVQGDGSNSSPSMSISKKEGTICVKQMGWHTGWRREESRILGVFRAVPLEEARRRDKF